MSITADAVRVSQGIAKESERNRGVMLKRFKGGPKDPKGFLKGFNGGPERVPKGPKGGPKGFQKGAKGF